MSRIRITGGEDKEMFVFGPNSLYLKNNDIQLEIQCLENCSRHYRELFEKICKIVLPLTSIDVTKKEIVYGLG